MCSVFVCTPMIDLLTLSLLYISLLFAYIIFIMIRKFLVCLQSLSRKEAACQEWKASSHGLLTKEEEKSSWFGWHLATQWYMVQLVQCQ